MPQIIISTGVHSTEINASRSRNARGQTYAEELAEKLRAKGHEVRIIHRPGNQSSAAEVLEFNFLKTILAALETMQIYYWSKSKGILDPNSYDSRFFDALSHTEKSILNRVLNEPETIAVFGKNYEENRFSPIFQHGLELAKRLKPLFEKQKKLMQKAWGLAMLNGHIHEELGVTAHQE